jgi:hypothetical protein
MLSSENASKGGETKEILNEVIYILNKVSTSEEAYSCLAAGLEILKVIGEEREKLVDKSIDHNPNLLEVFNFLTHFLEDAKGGESLALVVGTLEKLYYNRFYEDYKVFVHNINQSGQSSNEVGDIDIYLKNKFYYAVEAKDKSFSVEDVNHAFSKMIDNHANKGQFIYGNNAKFESYSVNKTIQSFERSGFSVLFTDVYRYSKFMLFKTDIEDKKEFINTLINTSQEINSSDDTKKFIQNLIEEMGWRIS